MTRVVSGRPASARVNAIPKDADRIDYGLALVGMGRAWLDSVALEVVGK
jgi:hypothetical protein